jgi:hypothetical protein
MNPLLVALWRLILYGTTEKPLLLTNAIVPERRDWRNANKMFVHPRGCRCSTCQLAADLGVVVRQQRATS